MQGTADASFAWNWYVFAHTVQAVLRTVRIVWIIGCSKCGRGKSTTRAHPAYMVFPSWDRVRANGFKYKAEIRGRA